MWGNESRIALRHVIWVISWKVGPLSEIRKTPGWFGDACRQRCLGSDIYRLYESIVQSRGQG